MLNPMMNQRRRDRNHERQQAQFDAMNPKDAADKLGADPISERMAMVANSQMRIQALSVAFMLAATLSEADYDDEDILPSEVLDALMLEAFVDDDDEDIEGIDENVKVVFSAHVADALSTLSVEDSVIDDLFDDDVEVADAAALAAAETVLENMPDDGDDFDLFVAAFAYSDEDVDDAEESFDSMNGQEPQFDAAGKKLRVGKKTVKKVNGKTLTYKAVKAIRNGKKVTINKRIGGKPLLKAGQKAALKKARRKAGTGSAIKKQMKSFSKGMRMNLYKGNKNRLNALQKAGSARYFNA